VNNIHNFSILKRNQHLNEIQQTVFDVFIVGGGITGAGIALDAASRGLKVLLIEQNDFASGTSSRSTKLVHGGLRYLEKLQFKFVADLGRERKILHENAAHNVIPTSVILPIVKGGQLNKGVTYLALWLYERLAWV
jgi:glycerol-3-phosphate dehydrogenase